MPLAKKIVLLLCFQLFTVYAFSQTPSPTPPSEDGSLKVVTEEIKLNISAFFDNGSFADGLTKEDLVVNEDNVLHQAVSLRRIPAQVLIVLDVGNEVGLGKERKKTLETAENLINSLKNEDSIAVMQYGDKAEILYEWTKDKQQIVENLPKKIGFGKRSAFSEALNLAVTFFNKNPTENRHLVLIGDGVDSSADSQARNSALQNLLSTDINVHVISYTQIAGKAVKERKKSLTTVRKTPSLPPGAEPPIKGQTKPISISSISLDRKMAKKIEEQEAKIKSGEIFLSEMAESTNGEIYLPEDFEEMIVKTLTLAKNIDSQYVLTYAPKKSLFEAPDGQIRTIEVTSRKAGVIVQSRRKFVVKKKQN